MAVARMLGKVLLTLLEPTIFNLLMIWSITLMIITVLTLRGSMLPGNQMAEDSSTFSPVTLQEINSQPSQWQHQRYTRRASRIPPVDRSFERSSMLMDCKIIPHHMAVSPMIKVEPCHPSRLGWQGGNQEIAALQSKTHLSMGTP